MEPNLGMLAGTLSVTASWDNVADLFREADAHGTLDPDNMEPEESMEMYNHPSRMSPLRLKKRPLLIPGGGETLRTRAPVYTTSTSIIPPQSVVTGSTSGQCRVQRLRSVTSM